jgi:flagellar biosynthesis GTPase FlhF
METKFRNFGSTKPELIKEVFALATNPVVLINTAGLSTYATHIKDKLEILNNFEEETQIILFAWQGKFKTDMFELTKEQIDLIIK